MERTMDYYQKVKPSKAEDLAWNIPERKEGIINIIGGNAQSFRAEVKVSEYLGGNFPIEKLNLVLPDALKDKLPGLDNFKFLSSTESGSFADRDELYQVINTADASLILGDLSKNTITGKAVISALEIADKPTLVTRDAVDLIIENGIEKILMNPGIILFLTSTQLQKLLRAIYYPKMFLLSQSLMQAVEILHKFTLSYPVPIITFYSGQILIAKDGAVRGVEIADTNYSPILLFSGELASRVLMFNHYNPGSFLEATISAVL